MLAVGVGELRPAPDSRPHPSLAGASAPLLAVGFGELCHPSESTQQSDSSPVHSAAMSELLAEIVAAKRTEVARISVEERVELEARARRAGPTRDLGSALVRDDGRLAVIAELKRRSPSKGDLAPDLDPAATAREYVSGGAAALSVLTDTPYFGGSLDDLVAAQAAVHVPVLRKDFTIDSVQVFEARAAGADAILLIVGAFSDDGLLADLHGLARNLGLAVVVEVHDEGEAERALACGARIVGVNARDLTDFSEDLTTGERLAARLPGVVRIAESAIRSIDDAQRMADAGFHAVLVGEALARAAEPAGTVRGLAEIRARG